MVLKPIDPRVKKDAVSKLSIHAGTERSRDAPDHRRKLSGPAPARSTLTWIGRGVYARAGWQLRLIFDAVIVFLWFFHSS